MSNVAKDTFNVTYTPTSVYIAGLDVKVPEAGVVPIGTDLADVADKLTVNNYVAGADVPTTALTYPTDYTLAFCNADGNAVDGKTVTAAGDNYIKVTCGSTSKIIKVVCAPVSAAVAPAAITTTFGTAGTATVTFNSSDPAVTALTLTQPTGSVFRMSAASLTLAGTDAAVKTGSITVTLPAGTLAGTYETTITATYTWDGASYTATAKVTGTVNKAAQHVDITAPTAKTFGDAEFAMSAPAYAGAEHTGSTETATGAAITWAVKSGTAATITSEGQVTIVGAGDVVLTATAAEVTNKYNTASADYTLSIAKANNSWTTSLTCASPVVFPAVPAPNAVAANGTVTYEYSTDETNWSTIRPVNVGSYKVRARVAASANYNELVSSAVDFGITKGTAPTLTAPAMTLLSIAVDTDTAAKIYTYDLSKITGMPDGAGTLSYALQAGQSWTGMIVSISGSTMTVTVNAPKAAGQTDSIVVVVSSQNYSDSTATVTCNYVSKTDVSDKIAISNVTAIYGEDYTVAATYNGEDSKNFAYTFTKSGTTTASSTNPTDVGTYTITAAYEDDNLENGVPGHIGSKTATLTITKKNITVTADDFTITYGEEAPDYTATVATAANDEELAVSFDCGYTQGDDAGNYTITPSADAADDANAAMWANYNPTFKNGTLTVNPKSIEGATVNLGAALTYNGSEQAQTVASVVLGSTTLTAVTDYTVEHNTGTNAGSYTLTVKGTGNYTGSVSKTFTIAKKNVSIIAAVKLGANLTYTGKQLTPELTVTASPDTLTPGTDYTVTYGENIHAGTNAGSFAVNPVAGSNYTFSAINGTFTIVKAMLTATYTGDTVYVNGTPAFNVTVNGFVNNETAGTALAYVAPTVTHVTTTAGTYSVEPINGSAHDYAFKYVAGNLVVLDRYSLVTGGIGTTGLTSSVLTQLPNAGKYTVTQSAYKDTNTYDVTIKGTAKPTASTPTTFGLGSGTWIGVVVTDLKQNGTAVDLTKVSYSLDNGDSWKAVTADDIANAKLVGGGNNAFVLWLNVGTDSSKNYTAKLKIVGSTEKITLNISYTAYKGGVSGYSVTIPETDGGYVYSDKQSAKFGDTVTLTVVPDKGYHLADLTVLDSNGNEIELTENKNGTYSFKMPNRSVTVKAVFYSEWKNPYVDVSEKDWFYDDVRYVTDAGLMNGVSANRFAPDQLATRAQIVTVLWRMAGSPTNNVDSGFTDLTQNWYKAAVNWATAMGITKGVGNGHFAPDEIVTREQFVTFLYRYAIATGKDATAAAKLTDFTDRADVSAWALSAVRWAVAEGILAGSDSKLNPLASATRAQLAAMIARYDRLYK